ncbi:MAG TPA: pseudouridine synthase [Nannocystaceae bacterium]|nr:pseudouridine synthase [Nannocystaceae bacterium]
MSALVVLYRDDRLVAVDKPAGMVVHRSEQCPDGVPVLQNLRNQIRRRVWPLHRLDRATSGVLLFALDADAARQLSQQFERHEIDKRYHAIVRGWTELVGSVDWPLREHPDAPFVQATTSYRRLATLELPIPLGAHATVRYACVEAQPHTGRMHQLRRHFAHLRHPIVGDVRHGDGKHNRIFRALGLSGMMLRAVSLTIRDLDDRELTIVAPPTGLIAEALVRLPFARDQAVAPPSITSV